MAIPVSIKHDFGTIYKQNMLAYLDGKMIDVNVIISGAVGWHAVKCEAINSNTEMQIILGFSPRYRYGEIPKAGSTIRVYQSQSKPKLAMPDVDYLKAAFSLTTTIL